MGIIKGVLKEELENSHGMQKSYKEEIAKIKGCLIRKKIGRHFYYYLAKRQGNKIKFIYKGPISEKVKVEYTKQRRLLKKYKMLLSKVNNQIKFLKRALRGKEAV